MVSAQFTSDSWWLVDLARDPTPGGRLVKAPDDQAALTIFRTEVARNFTPPADCRHEPGQVAQFARATVYAGPLTGAEALAHDLGWTWAWEMGEPRYTGRVKAMPPAGPVTRSQAVHVLGEALTADIERQLAAQYQ